MNNLKSKRVIVTSDSQESNAVVASLQQTISIYQHPSAEYCAMQLEGGDVAETALSYDEL